MQFQTLDFGLLVVATLLCFHLVRGRARVYVLIGASICFYSPWGILFLGLIAGSSSVDFFAGRAIHRLESKALRPALLMLSLCVNLSILAWFKYANFFLDNLRALLGPGQVLTAVDVILPPGISFYTFQSMSYTIDIYRRKIQPAKSFSAFLLYVSFFPQLVAGPIERAERLLPQFEHLAKIGAVRYRTLKPGLVLIVWGLAKKLLLADHLGVIADAAFANPDSLGFWTAWLGTYAFTLQIYCDFSAYSEIAKGTALLFGIRLMWNFDQPYLASDPSDFWRRWHISLSDWFRDYVYIPLGGSRHGRGRAIINLSATMFLSGLWHGAAWTFVLWGMIHGVWLALQAGLRSVPALTALWTSGAPSRVRGFLKWFFFFHLVTLSWVPFRAGSFYDMLVVWEKMLLVVPAALPTPLQWLGFGFVAVFLGSSTVHRKFQLERKLTDSGTTPLVLVASLMILIALFGNRGVAEFIYFQF
ncbi:MAG: MBOAT family protein [Polyangiaceae bacterium]|nr:MBOAT family protein [Polyangiaceae bacterium]